MLVWKDSQTTGTHYSIDSFAMNQYIYSYFKKGISLTNKSWILFLFGLTLALLTSLPNLTDKWALQIIGSLLLFVSFGFTFSLPIFLLNKQEDKLVDFGQIISTSLQNTKRLILPLILIGLIISITLLLLLISVIFVNQGNINFIHNMSTWKLFIVLLSGPSSFFTFAPIYFSLEKNGLLSSIKKSIVLGVKHLDFIAIIFVISASTFLILDFLLKDYQSFWQLFTKIIVYQYEVILITSTSLIFYQSHRRKGISMKDQSH